MTRDKAKSFITVDRVIAIIGFLGLFVGLGISWGITQGDIKANAREVADVRVDFVAADAAMQSANATRFRRIDATNDGLTATITTQAVLLERIVTTTEFIQRDVSKLVDQGGN